MKGIALSAPGVLDDTGKRCDLRRRPRAGRSSEGVAESEEKPPGPPGWASDAGTAAGCARQVSEAQKLRRSDPPWPRERF